MLIFDSRHLQEPLDRVVHFYEVKLLEMTGEEPFATAKILEVFLRDFQDSCQSEEERAASWAKLESVVGPLDAR